MRQQVASPEILDQPFQLADGLSLWLSGHWLYGLWRHLPFRLPQDHWWSWRCTFCRPQQYMKLHEWLREDILRPARLMNQILVQRPFLVAHSGHSCKSSQSATSTSVLVNYIRFLHCMVQAMTWNFVSTLGAEPWQWLPPCMQIDLPRTF